VLKKSVNPAGNPAGSSIFRNHVEWSFKWCPLLQKSEEKKNEARAHSATSPLPPGTGRSSMMFAIVSQKGSKYPVDPRSMCGWFIATTFLLKLGCNEGVTTSFVSNVSRIALPGDLPLRPEAELLGQTLWRSTAVTLVKPPSCLYISLHVVLLWPGLTFWYSLNRHEISF
jgi:hypothetical protein